MKLRKVVLSALGAISLIVVLGCQQGNTASGSSGSAATTGGTAATISSSEAKGDFTLSGAVGMTDGKLAVNLAAIRDPSNPALPLDPATVTLSASVDTYTGRFALGDGSRAAQTFKISGLAASGSTPIDIVFINDTTQSMAGATTGIANSIASFASSLAKSGVNAQFSMYTYGDAFATKKTTGSEFTKGKGDFVPSSKNPWDSIERPYIGLCTLADFTGFITELKSAKNALGIGGYDDEENTIGALDYANKKVAFRAGSNHVFVVIGDHPSHQAGDGDVDTYLADFKPRTGAAVLASLVGTSTVHVIGTTDTYGLYYPLKNLSDGTGGGFISLPSSGVVDLNTLGITKWVSSGFTGTGPTLAPGTYKLTITATYTASGVPKTATLTFIFTVS